MSIFFMQRAVFTSSHLISLSLSLSLSLSTQGFTLTGKRTTVRPLSSFLLHLHFPLFFPFPCFPSFHFSLHFFGYCFSSHPSGVFTPCHSLTHSRFISFGFFHTRLCLKPEIATEPVRGLSFFPPRRPGPSPLVLDSEQSFREHKSCSLVSFSVFLLQLVL